MPDVDPKDDPFAEPITLEQRMSALERRLEKIEEMCGFEPFPGIGSLGYRIEALEDWQSEERQKDG